MGAAALAWHNIGACVVPTQPGKRPFGEWKAYQAQRPTRDQVAAWFAHDAEGLGLICGAVSGGLEMAELEGRAVEAGAVERLGALAEATGCSDLFERVTTGYAERTPSGGLHFIYRVRGGHVEGNTKLASREARPDELTDDERQRLARNSQARIVRGLAETRGEGGFVVLAPSGGRTHPTGKAWEVVCGGPKTVATVTVDERETLLGLFRSLDETPRQPAEPQRQRSASAGRPGDDFAERTEWAEILEPHGWTYLGTHGGAEHWRRPGKAEGTSATVGYGGSDLLYVFTSSTEFDSERSYTKFAAYAVLNHRGDYQAAARALVAEGYGTPSASTRPMPIGAGWEDPLPLGWRPTKLPSFPVDAMPPVLAEYIDALATATQTPADLCGSVVLGIIAACTGGRVRVEPWRGWIEPTNLFVVPVLAPGSRKSSVISRCREPLDEVAQQLRDVYGPQIRQAAIERDIREGMARQRKDAAIKSGDGAAIAEAIDAAEEAEGIKVPAMPRLTVNDATPEALVSMLAEQGGRLAAISPEAGVFDSLTGRYSAKSHLDSLLMAHAGDAIEVDRKGREVERIAAPALTLVASIQPYALREMVERPDFAGRGLLARILWALAPDIVGYREVFPPPVPPPVENAYKALVTRLAAEMYQRDEPITLGLTEAAIEALGTYARAVEQMLRPDESLGAALTRQWGSKLVGASVRIAGCLQAAHGRLAEPISASVMRDAVRLAEFFRAHAMAALSTQDDERATLARQLIEYLTGKGLTRFRARDIQRGGPGALRKADTLKPLLTDLAEAGWLRAEEGGYAVHPEAGRHLAAGGVAPESCDTRDTRDTETETTGQRGYGLSQPAGDTMRHPFEGPDGSQGVAATVRHPEPPLPSTNGRGVAGVAPVAEKPCDSGPPKNVWLRSGLPLVLRDGAAA